MKHPVVVGLQYGDEGKGKVTDLLAQEADWVIRFNGGSNAGHTIWLNGKKVVTHSVPSGVLYEKAQNYIGAGCVIEPRALRKELNEIATAAAPMKPERLKIDFRAHLTLPIHLALDGVRETTNQSIGTTKRGIGPTYVTKMDRLGVRAGDLRLPTGDLKAKIEALCQFYNPLLKASGGTESSFEENFQVAREAGDWMLPFLVDELTPFYDVARQKRCLLEGAQGVLLDADHGRYPFVTSSNTIAGAAAAGAPFPLSKLGPVIGIAKAYLTRVGLGEIATELFDETGERIRKNGHEFGATTGRPRRVGWLNLDELRAAVRLSDCTYIFLTKSDVLTGEKEVKALYEGEYHSFPGWPEMHPGGDTKRLHPNLEAYLGFIEKAAGVPVLAVGTGTDRSALHWRHGRPDFWKV